MVIIVDPKVGGGGAPSGAAGGILGGTYPNPSFGFTGLTIDTGVLTNIDGVVVGFNTPADSFFTSVTTPSVATAGQLTLKGRVSTGNDTVQVTSLGRADLSINAVSDIAVLGFSGNGTRQWNNYIDFGGAAFHIQKIGTGDVMVYTATGIQLPQFTTNGVLALSGGNGTLGVAPPQSGTGTATGFTQSTGTIVMDASTFTGGSGSTAYRISDIILALKNLKLLAA